MSIVENGHHRGLNPRDIRIKVVDFVKRPETLPTAIMLGIVTVFGGAGLAISAVVENFIAPAIKNSPPVQAMDESYRRAEAARVTATQTVIDSINRDYQETGGIDIVKHQAGYMVTPRESARLALDSVLIDNAWARIRKETGCDPVLTVSLPEVPGAHVWDPPIAPRSYLIGVRC